MDKNLETTYDNSEYSFLSLNELKGCLISMFIISLVVAFILYVVYEVISKLISYIA